MMKGVLDPSSLPLEVADTTMLGKPACSLAYKLNMGGQRQVEQTWTENRGRSFIVTRAGPGTTSPSTHTHTHTTHTHTHHTHTHTHRRLPCECTYRELVCHAQANL
jgi:hypothetical protein